MDRKYLEFSQQYKNLDELQGGLRTNLKLPWYYPPLFESSDFTEDELNERCLKTIHIYSDFPDISNRRRHGRLIHDGTVLYFPATVEKLQLPSKLGTHLWQIYSKSFKPDAKYIILLEKALLYSLTKLENCKLCLDGFVLNESLVNFNWLSYQAKEEVILTIESFLRDQPNLITVILENALLLAVDGIRLLYFFGFHCGQQLEYLNITYFFKIGIHPIKNVEKNDYTIYDELEFTKEDDIIPTKEEQNLIKEKLLIKEKDNPQLTDLPYTSFYLYKVCLNLFSALTSLHIQYSYLCAGQGKSLCHVGSIFNGTLENLYLLCTQDDLPKNTNQVISAGAWKEALSKCPKLKLHLIISCVPQYDYIKTIIFAEMPLISFYMDSSISLVNFKRMKWYFDCTIKMLTHKFCHTLRVLNIHIWHIDQKIDVVISRCITHLFNLRKFEYRGPFDKLDTINELCSFITSNSLRLKLFHLYILEDACYPGLYQEAANNLYEEYIGKFIAKGINFLLQTSKI